MVSLEVRTVLKDKKKEISSQREDAFSGDRGPHGYSMVRTMCRASFVKNVWRLAFVLLLCTLRFLFGKILLLWNGFPHGKLVHAKTKLIHFAKIFFFQPWLQWVRISLNYLRVDGWHIPRVKSYWRKHLHLGYLKKSPRDFLIPCVSSIGCELICSQIFFLISLKI